MKAVAGIFIFFICCHSYSFDLDDVERREIPLTPKVFRFDFSLLENERSPQISAYSKSLRDREIEFRLRCKLFGLDFRFGGIVQRSSTVHDYDSKKEIVTIQSNIQCIRDSEEE